MKDKLIDILVDIVRLLNECNYNEKAVWFQQKADLLSKQSIDSKEARDEIIALKKIIAGMGSFSDLPLVPSKDSKITISDVRKKQWELVEQLDSCIQKILN